MQSKARMGPAQIARQAMLLMAERRLVPTPENYRHAWEQVSGETCALPEPASDKRAATLPQQSQPIDWADEIARLVAALDRVAPGWTPARKRDGLSRVLGTSRDPETLSERLRKLALAWARAHGELTELVPAHVDPAPGAATLQATPALVTAPVAKTSARPAGPMDPAAGDELAELAIMFCESLVAVAQSQQWGEPIVEAVRGALVRPVQLDAVRAARELLSRTHDEQSRLAQTRQATNDALHKTMSQWTRWIGDLDETTDRFSVRLQSYADQAGQCEQVDDARRLVASVVTDAGTMRAEIAASRQTFVRAREKAEELQTRVSQLESKLAEASTRMLVDELTKVFNRRGLEHHFSRLERDSRLRKRALSVAMIDIDDFKRLNDELGHQGGDLALRHLCVQLAQGLGPTGLLARFGGEEFVLLFPGADIDKADAHLAELREQISQAVFDFGGQQRTIRFSAGITACVNGDSLESCLRRADEALYRAKRAGKNCVRRALASVPQAGSVNQAVAHRVGGQVGVG